MRHWAEEAAREHLKRQGLRLLAENYPVRGGEIDLIMLDGEETVFVEVRQRAGDEYGTPGESIDARKLARLRRAARTYLVREHGSEDLPVRFDAVLVSGTRSGYRLDHMTGIG